MKIYAQKFFSTIREDGFSEAIKKVNRFLLTTIGKNHDGVDPILERRMFISKKINSDFNGIIRYGPFAGLKFSDDYYWGGPDRASMLLGIYEKELLTSLLQIPARYRYFVNIGAADGYYGIGTLVGGLFTKSFCYEISEKGQSIIKINSEINRVADRIVIRGAANAKFHEDFTELDADQSVLFVDIEGGEFEIFNQEVLSKFKNSVIFIELHDWNRPDGEFQLNKLKEEVEKLFRISRLSTTSRDLSSFEELRDMSDTDRWLICSEGRPLLMNWWRLDPL